MSAGTKAFPAAEGEVPPRIGEAILAGHRGESGRDLSAPVAVGRSALLIGILAVVATVLYLFNPAQFGFYPVCQFYKTTGLLCPGCGSLRALHNLLHGHFAEAFRFNQLLVFSLPAAVIIAGFYLKQKALGKPFALRVKPLWGVLALVVLILFTILRNLPFARAHGLAP
jgi:hypothetical protein